MTNCITRLTPAHTQMRARKPTPVIVSNGDLLTKTHTESAALKAEVEQLKANYKSAELIAAER